MTSNVISEQENEGKASPHSQFEAQRNKLQIIVQSEFGLLSKLRSSGVLTVTDEQTIKADNTTIGRNQKLLQAISERGKYHEFIDALRKSGQTHVVNLINGNGVYRPEFGLDWPLTEREIGILDSNYDQLGEMLNVKEELIRILFSRLIINERQKDFISSKLTSCEANEAFLHILRQSSLKTYFLTVQYLRELNEVRTANILENIGIAVPVHVSIGGENVDEVETQLIKKLTLLYLEDRASCDNAADFERILAWLRVSIISAKKGLSIVLFVSCCTVDEFRQLCTITDNNDIKKVLEKLFNQLLQNFLSKVLFVRITESDREKAETLFQRELLRNKKDDDHFQQLGSQLKYEEPVKVTTEESIEECKEEELPQEESEEPSTSASVEGIEYVQGRVNDPFGVAVSKITAEIENRMKNCKDFQALVTKLPNIAKVFQPPAQCGHESYTKFLALLRREIAKYSQEIRRFFLSCQEHLEVYNNALLINADCRTIDAVEHIKSCINERISEKCRSFTSDEADLNKLYARNIINLERMSRTKEAENPKLKYLEGLILGYYKMNPKSQGIIFCKTSFMTTALVKWIQETESLKALNPYHMEGSGSTAEESSVSMTHRKLENVLKYFEDGHHKIVVATSVAKECLDVKSCDYVIRYGHENNEIARVQSIGGARAEDAKYVLVGYRGGGVRQREATDQIGEDLMRKAISTIRQKSVDDFESQVLEHQRTAKQEREVAAATKLKDAKFKTMAQHENEYQLRCFRCDNFGVWSSDLRTIKGSYHVVVDPEFRHRTTVEALPKPKKYDDLEKQGKVFCKDCGYDWGITALYKNVTFYLLKVCSFVVEDPAHDKSTYRKWKEAPFQVNELEPEDMESLISIFSNLSI